MAGIEKPISEWKLDHVFEDQAGERITCDRKEECSLGSYIVEERADGELYSPACQTCDFSAGIADVFDTQSKTCEMDVPSDFKLAAARIMMDNSLRVMGLISPDTLAEIEQTIATAESQTL